MSKTWSEDAQDAYERKSQRAAEYLLERVMRRLRWSPDTRDDLALQMRIFANERHAELTSTRKKEDGRAEKAEAKLAKAVEALEKLARLGNGDRYGNSDGNMIARTTLAELKGEK